MERSLLAKIVVTILNIIRITEIPAEMLIGKLLGVVSKSSFVIVAEIHSSHNRIILCLLQMVEEENSN